jgi:hypothetical protein
MAYLGAFVFLIVYGARLGAGALLARRAAPSVA